jgi:serine/threonine protein kinase
VTDDRTFSGLWLCGRYRLDQPVARGALCVVYRALDETLHRQVAVKAVPPDHTPAFRAALEQTSALTHPGVVFVLDAVAQDDWLFLVQEYVQGTSLASLLHNGLAVERALDLGVQLARCLAYAHGHNIVHGDVTPAAVLIEKDGTARLNNFALPPDPAHLGRIADAEARLVHALDIAVARVEPADSPDSPDSPDPSAPSPPEDLRALGMLLWQALATSSPGGDLRDFRADVSAEVRSLVARLLVRGHPQRLAAADEAVAALDALSREVGAQLDQDLQPTPPALQSGRRAQAEPWSTAETVVDVPAWSPSEPATSPSFNTPAAMGSQYDTTPIRHGPSSGPLRRGPSTGPVRAGASGALRTAPLSGPLRAGPSGALRSYGPSSQAGAYHPAAPIPWSDDPQVARWAAEGMGRPYALGPSSGRRGIAAERKGIGVAPVVLIGALVFLICFVIGYVAPVVIHVP